METVTEARAVVPANETARRLPVSLGRRTEASGESPAEDSLRLSTMQRAFRASGGLLGGDSVRGLLREGSDQPVSLLARWIVGRQIVSFDAHGQRWIPMFQFEPGTMSPSISVQRVIAELRDVFDDWELTQWFASPNAWLRGESPSDALIGDASSVLETARADRFVATG